MNLNNFQFFTLAYGGDIVYDSNGYRIHTFKQNGLFTVINTGLIDILVVGGGAGGGVNVGGGGGGIIYQSNIPVQLGQINIQIGTGGFAYPDTTNGTLSSFSNIITAGGGIIGNDLYQGGTSGSPQNWLGYNVVLPYGGGGGGASSSNTYLINNGINGTSNTISGGLQYYGGGGGGCGCNLTYEGLGGLGGGGNGNYKGNDNTINALPNTGGGGGACGNSIYTGGRGGSGIVIVRYTIPETNIFLLQSSNSIYQTESQKQSILSNIIVPTSISATSTAASITTQNINGSNYIIHKFISSGTITFTSISGLGYIDALVVGGGGGGSSYGILGISPGNGGGGGEVIYQPNLLINSSINGTTYSITVGTGGQSNQNGLNSSFGSYIIANGGYAGLSNYGGKSGNNNYGGSYYIDYTNSTFLLKGAGGAGSSSYGFSGTNSNIANGFGGNGILNTINGSNIYYGTGGGGGGLKSLSLGWQTVGAIGGNLNSNNNSGGGLNTLSQSATSNTGSGGGGAGQGISGQDMGGSGSAGIVIIRYNI